MSFIIEQPRERYTCYEAYFGAGVVRHVVLDTATHIRMGEYDDKAVANAVTATLNKRQQHETLDNGDAVMGA